MKNGHRLLLVNTGLKYNCVSSLLHMNLHTGDDYCLLLLDEAIA